jgi:hypothetical protein
VLLGTARLNGLHIVSATFVRALPEHSINRMAERLPPIFVDKLPDLTLGA